MDRPRLVAALLLVAALTGACGGGSDGGGNGPSGEGSPSEPAASSSGPSGPASSGPASSSAHGSVSPPVSSSSVPVVTSTVAGTAVAGNSGGEGEGQTGSRSESVRAGDGSCTGWAGRGGGTWTQGLVDKAPIRILDDATGASIGTGVLGRGRAVDVDPSEGGAQWDCVFPFTASVRGPVPRALRLVVAGAAPMVAVPDPTAPGKFVASVSTNASPKLVPDCDQAPAATGLVWPPVVGTYWDLGLGQICNAGVGIAKVERVCRPAAIGSDAIVAVLKGDDPSVVYEDASGLKVQDPDLGPSPTVVVRVANGRPCG